MRWSTSPCSSRSSSRWRTCWSISHTPTSIPASASPRACYRPAPMNRLLYVCLDGLGDDPIPEFGGQTPLEAADTPFLDSLAQRGRLGSVTTVGPGIAPESDIAVFAILGYDPREEHPGRGVVEAVGTDMDCH